MSHGSTEPPTRQRMILVVDDIQAVRRLIARALPQTLDEEGATDKLLTALAEQSINVSAVTRPCAGVVQVGSP